jgi:hypothetical protein
MTFARATHRRRPASHRTMVGILCSGVVLVLAVAGCGPTSPPPGAPSTEAPPDGLVLAEMRYSCGDPPGFLPTILDDPATAETEDHPSAAALRAAIAQAGLDIDMLPESGYWLASRDERVAEYIAREPAGADPAFVSATLENQGGAWRLAGWGQCRPQIVLEGLSLATWVLDPDAPAPGPGTRTFDALVTERDCTSGQPMGARLRPPSVTYGRDSVFVVFFATPQANQGFATCPGNPPARVRVELSEPLGDRRLLDAALFPPAEPVAPEF